MKCERCKSDGFEPSITGTGCTFCDGFVGGNTPSVPKLDGIEAKLGLHKRIEIWYAVDRICVDLVNDQEQILDHAEGINLTAALSAFNTIDKKAY
jgi:hypothetical protein